MSADARLKYDNQLKAMRANRNAAHKKLQEIRTASESAWQTMQAGELFYKGPKRICARALDLQ